MKNTISAMLEEQASIVKAARDTGTKEKDKARKAMVFALVGRANALLERASPETPNDVVDALKTAVALQEHMAKLDDNIRKLRAAPSNSVEAGESQLLVDAIRKNVDLMTPALKNALGTFEPLFAEAEALEQKEKALKDDLDAVREKLAKDRERLKNAAMLLRGASSLY